MKLRLLALSTAFLLAVACGGEATPDAPAPLVTLPADEGPHDSDIEWWYFNGLLTDDRGQEYSYHYVTFQSAATGGAVPHLLQASLGDHTTGEHLTGEQVLLNSLDADATGIDIAVNGWKMQGDGQSYSLEFDLKDYSLDLEAVSVRAPVLHHGLGLVSLGPAGDTFYYSRTRLDATGSININGQQRPITGITWMDHQWGDDISQRVGWDWANVQLDDGSDLMAVMVWDPENRTPFATYGTSISLDGTMWDLNENDLSITSTGTWTSPATGIEYPSGWTLTVPVLDLNLTLEPVLVDSEFAGSLYTPAAYWEGEVSVSGTRQGQVVGGRGFVELVGYDPSQSDGYTAP
jgi:predicted secreted hydrolase